MTETVAQRVNRRQLEGNELAAIALSDRPEDLEAIDNAIEAGARWTKTPDFYALDMPGSLQGLGLVIVDEDFEVEFSSNLDKYRK